MRLHEKNKKHSVPLRDPHQDMLAGIRELAPEIKARAAEIEAARRVPPDLVERLRSIGLDYLGAAPVRGTRYGGGAETLTVAVKVEQAGRGGQSQSQSQRQS